jgi:hypothetical protein
VVALACRRISIRASVARGSDRARTAAIPADGGFECQHNLAGPNTYPSIIGIWQLFKEQRKNCQGKDTRKMQFNAYLLTNL